jgi:hypothetical protein
VIIKGQRSDNLVILQAKDGIRVNFRICTRAIQLKHHWQMKNRALLLPALRDDICSDKSKIKYIRTRLDDQHQLVPRQHRKMLIILHFVTPIATTVARGRGWSFPPLTAAFLPAEWGITEAKPEGHSSYLEHKQGGSRPSYR